MSHCWCDSGLTQRECCQPLLEGERAAATPEALMRSRYSAFVTENADYLLRTWHPATRPRTISFDSKQRWLGLKVIETSEAGDEGEVSFVARYKIDGKGHRLREDSCFSKLPSGWVYVGQKLTDS